MSMCVCLYALGGVAQALKMDPSGLALSGQVPVEGKGALGGGTKMMMMRREGGGTWWLLAVRGPAGKEQPANEEPSEASIHLEHGPLQLP